MPILYIVATPIGNLEDLSFRALRILREADLILCEDTRRTRKLLSYYKIKNRVLSYHQHSKLKKIEKILKFLKEGKNLALVSDAGTPGISDPGNELIKFLIKRMPDLRVIPVPGPSAITAAASISGFPMDKFLFLGFPPTKKKRKKFFKEVANSKYPVIFFESPYRVLKTLKQLKEAIEQCNNEGAELVVCRELTKKFEIIYRGNTEEVLEEIGPDKIKGEFVIILNRK